MNSKFKIHIRNNHWKHGSLPCDPEGELNSTITKEEFEKGLSRSPELRDKVEYFIDWDDDNFILSMKSSDILLGWNFPTENLKEIAPNLKWIHVISAGVNHLTQDTQVLLDQSVSKVQSDIQDILVIQDIQVLLDQSVNKVQLAILDTQDIQDILVILVILVHKESKV